MATQSLQIPPSLASTSMEIPVSTQHVTMELVTRVRSCTTRDVLNRWAQARRRLATATIIFQREGVMSKPWRGFYQAFRGVRVKHATVSVSVLTLITLSGIANAAGTKTITLRRCGYMHQILPGGPLSVRGRYAVYGWHMSCDATRALLVSQGSRIPQFHEDTPDAPTAVLTFRGMRFVCQSGDAGGGDCGTPYRLRQASPGVYVVAGRRTRIGVYRNCSFAGLCTATVTEQP